MEKNVGTIDKSIRLIIALLIITLYFSEGIPENLTTVMMIPAGIFLLTSLGNFCPLYLPYGISTCRRTNSEE